MTPDHYLVIGVIVVALAIPGIFAAIRDNHAPRLAAVALLVGSGFIAAAFNQRPGGYSFEEIPEAFVNVFATIF